MNKPESSQSVLALAFETSSDVGSVALGQGHDVLETCFFSAPRRHAAEFIPVIDQLCSKHYFAPGNVRTIFVSTGPGSFTGLRIGVTAARMLAMANGARIVAVNTLSVIAHNALKLDSPPDRLAILLDAKRKRVYAGSFIREGNEYRQVDAPTEADPREFLNEQPQGTSVMGEGVKYHAEVVQASGLHVIAESYNQPGADMVYRLGMLAAKRNEFTEPRELVPTYIRLPEAEEKWQQRQQEST